jgi:hypothetical protein
MDANQHWVNYIDIALCMIDLIKCQPDFILWHLKQNDLTTSHPDSTTPYSGM